MPKSTQRQAQIAGEVIVVSDDAEAEAQINRTVRPSIEDTETQSGSIFYDSSELLAELNRRASEPEPFWSPSEPDFMAKLDNLAAPNQRGVGGSNRQSPEQRSGLISSTSIALRDPTFESSHEPLEDMLAAFQSYEMPVPELTTSENVDNGQGDQNNYLHNFFTPTSQNIRDSTTFDISSATNPSITQPSDPNNLKTSNFNPTNLSNSVVYASNPQRVSEWQAQERRTSNGHREPLEDSGQLVELIGKYLGVHN